MSGPVRVVSLVPSVTETLLAWGVEPVACTRFCEQPSLRHVGGTKDPDVEAIVGLRPDLVVMDEEENRRDDAAALRAAGVAVHVTAVRSLADVAPTLDALAAALALPALALPGSGGHRAAIRCPMSSREAAVRVFVPIWKGPWMTVNRDTYGSSLLAAAGAENVFADHPERYPQVTLDDAAARGPAVVLPPSEPYPFGPKNTAELERVAPVVLVDGRDLFWWGVRTPDALSRLAAVVRPPTPAPATP